MSQAQHLTTAFKKILDVFRESFPKISVTRTKTIPEEEAQDQSPQCVFFVTGPQNNNKN